MKYQNKGTGKYKYMWKRCTAALLALLLAAAAPAAFYAEEYEDGYYEEYYEENNGEEYYEEEEEFIPEAYYDPIETNEISGWPQGPMVQAAGAMVMDLDTDTILYGKNPDQVFYPASTTKIMTTLLVLENCDDLDETFTCGPEVWQIEEDSTNLGIQEGEQLTVRQALYGVMLESANDLANAVGVYVAGSLSGFVDMMNERAAELGCTHTHFANPSGLTDEQHYTTARDLAKIAQTAYAREDFRTITGTTEYVIPTTNVTDEERGFLNHQKILRTDTEYYQSWCTGGKTGYTEAAWNTLVTYAEKDGQRLVCVLLRENGADKAYTETTALIEYGFNQFQKQVIEPDSDIPDFYELLKLNYPNAGTTVYQSDALKQSVMTVVEPAVVTIPADADVDRLTVKADGNGVLEYLYEGVHVGTGAVAFTPVPTDITLEYEQYRDMEAIFASSATARQMNELTQTADLAISNLKTGGETIIQTAVQYVETNTMTVIMIGVFVLAILLILIIILIMRVTRESRIRRRRLAEQRARQKAQEDIDRMSAVEIERQLREAMDEEQQRRNVREQREAALRAEEEKLRETEAIIEEISRTHAEDES